MTLATPPLSGQAPPAATAGGVVLRLTTPISAYGPLVVGAGTAVLARLLVDLEPLHGLWRFQAGRAEMALLWILPVAFGALISGTRTLWLELNPTGVRVRRMLGSTRTYETAEVVGWGFEYGRGAYSTMPPDDPRKSVRFVLRTADGYGFQKSVRGEMAERLSKLLIARCTPM